MTWGYWLRLLRVDLSKNEVRTEAIPEGLYEGYLGGAGFGTRLLYEETSESTNPLGPENKIIFATGPYQGTNVPGSAKWSVVSKSPLTNTFAVSTAGAEWGDRLKKAGYDFICIEGSSDKPVYLSILDDKVSIEDASTLWGKDAIHTTDMLKTMMPKSTSVIAIGPAGEKMVSIACIIADGHSFAGRCGIGAVMGAKKLKAIVVKGTKQVPVFDETKLRELNRDAFRILRNNTKETFNKHGTAVLVSSAEAVGDLPIKYWSGDIWAEEAEKIGAPIYTEKLNAKPWPCRNCPIGCHRKIMLEAKSGEVIVGAGAEYETLGMLGSCCLIDDLEVISKANEMCNRLGIDTISAGAFVAFTMECFEKGLITEVEVGYKALWGEEDTLIRLVKEIGEKKGFGAIFSRGIVAAAKQIGKKAESLAVHVKGLDIPAHDPRAYFSLAINYATSTRGACHLRGFPHLGESGMIIPEIGLNKCPDRFSMEGQAYLAIKFQDLCAMLDSLVCCMFMQASGMDLTKTTDIVNAITGWDCSPQELMYKGEKIHNLQRLINIRDGYDRIDDKLPDRMFEPASKGYRANKVPTDLDAALDQYYELRGWDNKGVPKESKLKFLKLI